MYVMYNMCNGKCFWQNSFPTFYVLLYVPSDLKILCMLICGLRSVAAKVAMVAMVPKALYYWS